MALRVKRILLEFLEEWLRAIEGTTKYRFKDATEICLVPNVVIPPKFKVLEFESLMGLLIQWIIWPHIVEK